MRARLVIPLALLFAGCGGGESADGGRGLAEGCSLNSECAASLVCSLGKCHAECSDSRDCPSGRGCVRTDQGSVCQTLAEAACAAASDCVPPLVCGADGRCRNTCQSAGDCLAEQVCTSLVCAEPSETGDAGQLPPPCDGPGEVEDPKTGRCFVLITDIIQPTWAMARTACAGWGGDLASIAGPDEWLFLSSHFATGNPLWTGGNDIAIEGTFVWSDGTPFSWTRWAEGQPDNLSYQGGIDADCLMLGAGDLEFEDYDCAGAYASPLCARGGRL